MPAALQPGIEVGNALRAPQRLEGFVDPFDCGVDGLGDGAAGERAAVGPRNEIGGFAVVVVLATEALLALSGVVDGVESSKAQGDRAQGACDHAQARDTARQCPGTDQRGACRQRTTKGSCACHPACAGHQRTGHAATAKQVAG